jgi:HD-GYP domain-containing protein (c-di-GMP phosphodiesterase class II)
MKSLRLKTYLTLLPVVVAAVVASGYLSFLESRQALTRLASRHLAYKAEQLRDYINSEWEVIDSLGLAGDAAYRSAQEESFRSYAYSLLRSDTELVLVLDAGGMPVYRIGALGAKTLVSSDQGNRIRTDIPPGWFSQEVLGEERVGMAFAFEPYGWTIAVTELRSRFFSEVDGILRRNILILVLALLCASLLTAAYLRHLIGPLERLSGAIARIAGTGDLSLRAPMEFQDEIGALASRFNEMVTSLETQNQRLSEANLAERKARETAVQREVETLFLLGRISDYNDEKTGAHLKRIGALSALFARLLGQGPEEEELLRNSSPLHDIGKIAIPESVLNKPGKLSPGDFEVIKRHTVIGHELLKDSESRYLVQGALIALTHHERWDGGGYPQGLAGGAIPLPGRIVSVVDVFDALVSDRPYKPAWTREAALDYIVSQGERQFDPLLVSLFQSHIADFVEIWEGLREGTGT